MDEIDKSINKKTSILLSRNNPVALVVGAGSFLGSHLVDKLLDKGIQVVGVDDLANGEKRNLRKAAENRNFHLVIESPDKVDLDLGRLDYLFIIPSSKWNFRKILELPKDTKCRCLLVSSIILYEKEYEDGEVKFLKNLEAEIAKYADTHNLNARILRLGSVFGPRMDFKTKDPLFKLIRQAVKGDLQKDVSLEFSSRALYVMDAVDLAIKTIMAGSTAQKIFDGVLPTPVKVSEIKQVLLDPVWYESRDFSPSELPPWPTPNLDKTVKFLNWHPQSKLVAGLRETLAYFKDNEIDIPELEDGGLKMEDRRKEELESFKQTTQVKEKTKKGRALPKFSMPLQKIYLFGVVALVTYALIWPSLVLGWGVFTFRSQLNAGLKNLEKGELVKSLDSIKQANAGVAAVKSVVDSLEPVRRVGLLHTQFKLGDDLLDLSSLTAKSAQSAILGVEALFQGMRAVTGEKPESADSYFSFAQVELSSSREDLSKANALLQDKDFNKNLPQILAPRINDIRGKLALYSNLVSKAQTLSVLLPELVALEGGNKNYLILLQNNMELRPGGGFIGSFAKISFERGKLKNLEVNDIYAIDGALSIHVEPPKEIKEDLGQKDWFLRDSNWESDFPTSARQAEWFYTKETGERVDGVVALDISALEELLAVTGPLDLPDYNEQVSAENLFEKAVTFAETGFFPGSQAKKSFLTALTNQLFNKIFFLPGQNWPGIVSALGRSLEGKHMSVYLNDPKLFSYVLSQGWTPVLPRASVPPQAGSAQDFLALVEANLGANKANYYLDRSYNLETVIGKEGEISHRLRISYTNRSPSDAFPGGRYKNRMRIYLPFGTKLTRVLWGEADITKDVTGFVDFGRSGYSLLLELLPKEQKKLVLDYSVPLKLEFQDGKAAYRLDVIKQQGTLKDPLQWSITYPISYQIISDQPQKVGPLGSEASPQEYTISTDLSTDRSFKVEFKK